MVNMILISTLTALILIGFILYIYRDKLMKYKKKIIAILTSAIVSTSGVIIYDALDGNGPTPAGPGDAVIGEMGVVVIEQMQWHNITFRNGPYDSIPVVIASPTTNNRGAGQEEDDCCGINDGDSRADDACDGILPVINWVGTTGFNCTIMYDNGTSAVPQLVLNQVLQIIYHIG